jgi:very-short-patch-repair endonuclease
MFRNRPAVGSTARARRLRRDRTEAENRLWWQLRQCFPDARFRFQVPIGPYVADFCSHRAKLIIEVDGGQHSASRDVARTAWLSGEGFGLLRVWNNDVLANADGVAMIIGRALHSRHPSPPPPPPPQGEGISMER